MHTFGNYSKKRENETVSNYHQLKLDAIDGGMGGWYKSYKFSRL